MSLFIEKSLITAPVWMPLAEGWLAPGDVDVVIEHGLTAERITAADVALLPAPITTGLGRTHLLEPAFGIVTSAIGPTQMRTPVRPDSIEETPIRLLNVGPTGEVLLRALLRSYFGITASRFVTDDVDPDAASAQVVIVDDAIGVSIPDFGHYEDLAKDWFVMTGAAVVHAVTAIGVEAEARGAGDQLALLVSAAAVGTERRRDVRGLIAAATDGINRDLLARLTNGIRYEITRDDRQSLQNLLSRGTWGTAWGKTLPAWRDELPPAAPPRARGAPGTSRSSAQSAQCDASVCRCGSARVIRPGSGRTSPACPADASPGRAAPPAPSGSDSHAHCG